MSNGNVGIGTTNPQANLHVQGNGLFSRYVLQNGVPCFHAIRTAGNLTGNNNIPIVFNYAVTNFTNSYNSSTGVFTAPTRGVYYFNVFGIGNLGHVHFDIFKNQNSTGIVPYENNGGNFQSTSGSGIVYLEENDQAHVRLIEASTMYGSWHNGFSGFLIG